MNSPQHCEKCGRPIVDGSRFCENCGSEVTPMVRYDRKKRNGRAPQQNYAQPGQEETIYYGDRNQQYQQNPYPNPYQQNSPYGQNPYPGPQYQEPFYRLPENQPYPNGNDNWQQPWNQEDLSEEKGITPLQYVLIGITAVLLIALIAFTVIWVAGRSTDHNSAKRKEKEQTEAVQNESVQKPTEQTAEGTQSSETQSTQEQNTENQNTNPQNAETQAAVIETTASTENHTPAESVVPEPDIILDYPDYTVTLPGTWKGKYGVTEGASYHSFYQRASREVNGAGMLFAISRYTDMSYKDLPSYQMIGTGNGAAYVFETPTDVQCAYENEEIRTEYQVMSDDLENIRMKIVLKVSGDGPKEPQAETTTSGYMPYSSERLVTAADVAGMSYDDVQMAINEIYARHGRKFSTPEIQAYFNAQPWYRPMIEPDDFTEAYKESVFNNIEKQNVNYLSQVLSSLG